jgi:hypothetical protein
MRINNKESFLMVKDWDDPAGDPERIVGVRLDPAAAARLELLRAEAAKAKEAIG